MRGLFWVAAASWTLAAPSLLSAETVIIRVEDTRPLTVSELESTFGDKTWAWRNGGAYFQKSMKRFMFASNQGAFADGIWTTPGKGRLCYRAHWTAETGTSLVRTCFSHRIDEAGRILQKREPDGAWYIFHHVPAKEDEAYSKLLEGNDISKLFNANRGNKIKKR